VNAAEDPLLSSSIFMLAFIDQGEQPGSK
jgi:hypothetical protein